MKTFCVLYSNGLSGTWLTWFINQHKGFPNRLELDVEYSDPTHPERVTDYTTQAKWWYGDTTWEEFVNHLEEQNNHHNKLPVSNFSEVSWEFDNIAYKVQPYHEFYGPDMTGEDSQRAAEHVLAESNCTQVIVPVCNDCMYDQIYNRLVAIRPHITIDKDPKMWYNKHLYEYINNTLDVDVQQIDIGLILSGDPTEYYTLRNCLGVPVLDNWRELANECKAQVYDNYNEI